MKDFASRIKKAGNLYRQSKRITDFGTIKENKKNKVIKVSFNLPDNYCRIVERKFQQNPGDSDHRPGRKQDLTCLSSVWSQLHR